MGSRALLLLCLGLVLEEATSTEWKVGYHFYGNYRRIVLLLCLDALVHVASL